MTQDDGPGPPKGAAARAADDDGSAEAGPGRRDPKRVVKRRVRRGAGPAEATPGDTRAPPQAMEPVALVEGEGKGAAEGPGAAEAARRAAKSPIVEVDVEREVIGTGLYRERRIVEEVVEEDVAPPTR